jgi:hypothetical protein
MRYEVAVMGMRYCVYDESNEVLRKFATKHEAEYFTRNDKELWIKVLPRIKTNLYGNAMARLGSALL